MMQSKKKKKERKKKRNVILKRICLKCNYVLPEALLGVCKPVASKLQNILSSN